MSDLLADLRAKRDHYNATEGDGMEDMLQALDAFLDQPLPVQPGSESREARWLRTLVDSDCEIDISHAKDCAGDPPERLDGKCPGCMWILAAGEVRVALGLEPLERGIVPSRRARPPSPETQRGDKT